MNGADDIIIVLERIFGVHIEFNTAEDIDFITVKGLYPGNLLTVLLGCLQRHTIIFCKGHIAMTGKTNGAKADFNGVLYDFLRGIVTVAKGGMLV